MLHRNDVPYRRRGSRKSLPPLYRKHSAANQAAPIQTQATVRPAPTARSTRSQELRSLSARHQPRSGFVSPRERAARNRGSQTRAAIPETRGVTHGQLSRRGKNSGPDGPLPRRTGSPTPAGSVGTRRETPPPGSRKV